MRVAADGWTEYLQEDGADINGSLMWAVDTSWRAVDCQIKTAVVSHPIQVSTVVELKQCSGVCDDVEMEIELNPSSTHPKPSRPARHDQGHVSDSLGRIDTEQVYIT